MKKLSLIICFTLFCSLQFFAQTDEQIETLNRMYTDLNYQSVTVLADSLLQQDEKLNTEQYIKISEMNAVALFALNRRPESRTAFISILKRNENYTPDPMRISPKIIDFFEEVRSDYRQIVTNRESSKDTTFLEPEKIEIHIPDTITAPSLSRSLVLPGWGHLYTGNTVKGWILSGAGTTLIGGIIYFIIDTNEKEDKYLFESNKQKIAVAYDEYNTAYKIRNSLIISYALLWMYSQLDILFFSGSGFSTGFNTPGNSITPFQEIPVFKLSYSF